MAGPGWIEEGSRRVLDALGYKSRFVATSVGPVHAWTVRGAGTLPPVVLFHGLGASALHWLPLARELAAHVSAVWALDLPGHGFSVRPAELTSEVLQRGLFEALAEVQEGPAVLVGNSLGGASAVRWALARPHVTLGLVLFSPAGAPLDDDALRSIRARFRVEGHAQAVTFVQELHGKPVHPVRAHLLAPFLRRSLQDPVVWRWLEQVADEDFLAPPDVRRLQGPVHVVFGRQERFFPPSAREFWREHLPPHAVLEEPDGMGHSPFLDDRPWASARIVAMARRAQR
jgi:pimeloyl-ACP methyl ester carboxylesterase